MGAFIGNSTQFFQMRRKMRKGRSTMTLMPAAPNFAAFSSTVTMAANRAGVMLCAQKGVGVDNYWRSVDFSATWLQVFPAGSLRMQQFDGIESDAPLYDNRIGQSGSAPIPTIDRQVRVYNELGLNPVNKISELVGAPNVPYEAFATAPNGRYFYAQAGELSGTLLAHGIVLRDFALLHSFDLSVGLNIDFNEALGIYDSDPDTTGLWIVCNEGGVIFRIRRKHNAITSETIANPGGEIRNFAQIGPIIIGSRIGGGAANQIIRSVNYGATFAHVTIPGLNGDVYKVRAHNGKFFALCNSAVRLFESFNGLTWTQSPQQPTQIPVTGASTSQGLFIVGGTGANRQCYLIRRPFNI